MKSWREFATDDQFDSEEGRTRVAVREEDDSTAAPPTPKSPIMGAVLIHEVNKSTNEALLMLKGTEMDAVKRIEDGRVL